MLFTGFSAHCRLMRRKKDCQHALLTSESLFIQKSVFKLGVEGSNCYIISKCFFHFEFVMQDLSRRTSWFIFIFHIGHKIIGSCIKRFNLNIVDFTLPQEAFLMVTTLAVHALFIHSHFVFVSSSTTNTCKTLPVFPLCS